MLSFDVLLLFKILNSMWALLGHYYSTPSSCHLLIYFQSKIPGEILYSGHGTGTQLFTIVGPGSGAPLPPLGE